LLTLKEERTLSEFENSVLRKITGPKRHEATREYRKLHSEDNPIIIWVIKLRSMKWVGHVAHMEERRCIQDFGVETCGKETTWKTQA
jgi:hypothetical protein